MHRALRSTFVAGIVGAIMGACLALAGAAVAEGPPCTIATKGDSPVAKACASGGIKQAKATMKDLAKRARAGGKKFECDDCHKDDVKYELTSGARDKFKELLAAAGS